MSGTRNTAPVTLDQATTALRLLVMMALGALALWLASQGANAYEVGVLILLAAVGFFVKTGRGRWYGVGVVCVFLALFLGTVSGPLFYPETTGYCDSVFEPFEPGHVVADDAPPGTYQVCEAVRRERIPVIAVLTVVGLAVLVVSLLRRRVPTQHEGRVEPESANVRSSARSLRSAA